MTTLRKFKLLAILAFVLAIPAGAQNCNCKTAFAWVKQTFEENDAGFQFVIDRRGEQAYAIHNQLIAERIKTATNKQECAEIIIDWLHFFRTGHIGFGVFDSNEGDIMQEFLASLVTEPPYLKRLNETTLYFRIPSFVITERAKIDSILNANRNNFMRTQNLIIDLRGNSGGSDDAWWKLFTFISSNPVVLRSLYFRSTELNNQVFREFDKNFYNRLNDNLGEFVLLHNQRYITISNYHQGNPRHVGIIVDRYVGSATESFLLLARQSRRVKLFGEPTAGVFDISNMNVTESPCRSFVLFYALSKGVDIDRFPIDGIGIQPDFFLGGMPDYEWVDFVNDILNRR